MTECIVCGGEVHPRERIDARYQGERYQFCSDEHKTEFDSNPELFAP